MIFLNLHESHLFIVYLQLVVSVYGEGNPGFLMYEQFWAIVLPHALTMETQQTPNLQGGETNPMRYISQFILMISIIFHTGSCTI